MKNILLVTSFIAAGLVTGCKPAAEVPAASPSTATTARQLDKAQTAATDAARQLHDYNFEQKTEFVAALQAQLVELNRNLDALSARIEKSPEPARAEARQKLAALREQETKLQAQLGAIKDATPSTWNGIKADSERAYTALKDGVTASRQWMSDKIAP
jgi:septal ring factor EnvC (AmiA/AmiB activator)